MNQTSKFAIELYHVALVLRESAEYAIRKNEYAKPIYDRNKDMITKLTAENSPFDNLLKQNGENGEKIRRNIADFIELVYADDARAVRIDDGKVHARILSGAPPVPDIEDPDMEGAADHETAKCS